MTGIVILHPIPKIQGTVQTFGPLSTYSVVQVIQLREVYLIFQQRRILVSSLLFSDTHGIKTQNGARSRGRDIICVWGGFFDKTGIEIQSEFFYTISWLYAALYGADGYLR
jgi:hypothetical protein